MSDTKNILILNKIIKWCIYLLVFLLPLWFLPFTSDVLNLNKQVLMIGLLTVALIAWLGELLTKEKIEWHKGLIVLGFLAFVIIYGLSTIFSIHPYTSLMGSDNHLSRALINVIYLFLFFILLINYQKDGEDKKTTAVKFLTIFLISSAISGIIGLIQILGGRIFSWAFAQSNSFNTIGSLTDFGIFLAVLMPVALSLLLSLKIGDEKKEKAIGNGLRMALSLLIVISLATILLLNYQMLWMTAAIGMLIVVGFWLSKRHSLPAQSLGWLAIPTTILALCLIFLIFQPTLFSANLPLELRLSSKSGLNIAKEIMGTNPILGTGPETFLYDYSLYKPPVINQTIFWNVRFANTSSEILNLISEIGILGVLAFLAAIGIFLWKIIKNLINPEEQFFEIKIGLFAGWLALVATWFLYPQNLFLIFVFWLFVALLTILGSKEQDIKTINLKTSNKIALITSFGFIIATIAIIGLLYLESSKFIAEINYQSGLNLVNSNNLDTGINKVFQATVANPREDKFYRDIAQLLLIQTSRIINNKDLTTEEKTSQIQLTTSNAINSSLRATTLDPKDVSNWIIQGSIYRNLIALVSGASNWALKSYAEALKLEPSNPFIYVEIARTYSAGADLLKTQAQTDNQAKAQAIAYLDKAVDAYNKAIELKSNYSLAHFELAIIYDLQGKTKEAIERMQTNKELAPKDVGTAFQLGVLLYKDSQFDKAQQEFERAIVLDENYSNARYFLGLILDKKGNRQEAIEQFEKIAQLNPDNDTIKQILTNLKEGKPALSPIPQQPKEIPVEESQPENLRTTLPTSK